LCYGEATNITVTTVAATLPRAVPGVLFATYIYADTPTPPIYTLSLHDALPISTRTLARSGSAQTGGVRSMVATRSTARSVVASRSEEHTSELQSRFELVCRLLLEKKNKLLTGIICKPALHNIDVMHVLILLLYL